MPKIAYSHVELSPKPFLVKQDILYYNLVKQSPPHPVLGWALFSGHPVYTKWSISYLAIFEVAVNADVCHQNYVLKEGDVDFLHVTLSVFTTRIAHC